METILMLWSQILVLFSLNCLFLANCTYFKVIQLFLKVFHLPGYMVGRCGEQFCEQVLLSGPLCCQKSWDSTPKSVQLYALPNFICSSEPFFLHSNQIYNHFPNPPIKGLQYVNLKVSDSFTIWALTVYLGNVYIFTK